MLSVLFRIIILQFVKQNFVAVKIVPVALFTTGSCAVLVGDYPWSVPGTLLRHEKVKCNTDQSITT